MNRVIANCAENGPETADDTGLLTMRNAIASHRMMADIFRRPAVRQAAFNRFYIADGRIGGSVVEFIAVLTQRNAGANRIR